MNKRIFLLLSIIALASLCSYSQKGKKFYKAGNKFYETMKYVDAVSQYSSAIELEPSNPSFYYARGRAYEALGDNNEAKTNFGKAIVFSPKYVDAYVRLGAVCNNLGQYKEALAYLNHATGLDKRNKAAYPEKVTTLLNLEKYDQALKSSDTALILIKDDPKNYYQRGLIYSKLNNDFSARKEFEKAITKDKSKRYFSPRIELAKLLLKGGDSQGAMAQCNEIIKLDDRDTAAFTMRSKVYKAILDFPNAINDISKNIMIDKNNPEFYLRRGQYYQEFNQHTNAINDFSEHISRNPKNYKAYFDRAKSYEAIREFENAMKDYQSITTLMENDPETYRANKLLDDAKAKLYDLKREEIAPEISVINPVITSDSLEIRGDSNNLLISGKVKDESKIRSFTINNEQVTLSPKNGGLEFLAELNVKGADKVTIVATDDYNNVKSVAYALKRTETNPPEIEVIAPFSSETERVIYPDRNSQAIYIEGKLKDESKIKSISIEGVKGSYKETDLNPVFSANNVDILNKDKIVIVAEDVYGNKVSKEYTINREGATFSESNPMGKTWVVFIENSDYTTFASLEGPKKDVSRMTAALVNYQIDRIILKKNMTKADMEKFFSIELRDLIKANQVKSLLIWYSGHGKLMSDSGGDRGYWIPVDAKLDDEITYFPIVNLRAYMEIYVNYLTHSLVVTDACETGPGFFQAMRDADTRNRSCDDWTATQFKSSQVFGSAGEQLAVDDSQFTRTFASALTNNRNACLPIEKVVEQVSKAVSKNSRQKPYFGNITGLRDEDGTFFFISK